DPPLLIESVEDIPVEAFPSTREIMQGELHKGKDDFVHFVLVIVLHIFSAPLQNIDIFYISHSSVSRLLVNHAGKHAATKAIMSTSSYERSPGKRGKAFFRLYYPVTQLELWAG